VSGIRQRVRGHRRDAAQQVARANEYAASYAAMTGCAGCGATRSPSAADGLREPCRAVASVLTAEKAATDMIGTGTRRELVRSGAK
jgi:hypothetical protein